MNRASREAEYSRRLRTSWPAVWSIRFDDKPNPRPMSQCRGVSLESPDPTSDMTTPSGGPIRVPSVNVVLIGPPGSGKGTQAVRLAERYGIPHISTGEILRSAVRAGSDLGRQVADIMANGSLVSDE